MAKGARIPPANVPSPTLTCFSVLARGSRQLEGLICFGRPPPLQGPVWPRRDMQSVGKLDVTLCNETHTMLLRRLPD